MFWVDKISRYLNPLLHRYSFLRLLQQMTFENIVTKEQRFQSFPTSTKMFISFSRVNIQDFCKWRLLQDCCFGGKGKGIYLSLHLQCIKLYLTALKNIEKYWITVKPVKQRPPKGETDFGLYKQVVFIWRLLCFI